MHIRLHWKEVHHDHFDLGCSLLNRLHQPQAVLILQSQIQENDLRFQLLCGLEHSLFSVSKGSDDFDVRLLIEHPSQTFAQQTVVFDQ